MSDETWVFALPELGESVTEGVVGNIFKQVGDEVAFDDPLFEVSTDKVDSEIPSPYDGTLLEILVQADQTVPVGTVLARIGDKSAPAATDSQPAPTTASPAATVAAPAATVAPASGNGGGRRLSQLVRGLVAEHGIDVSTVTGTGGRRPDQARVAAESACGVAHPGLAQQVSGGYPECTGDRLHHLQRRLMQVALDLTEIGIGHLSHRGHLAQRQLSKLTLHPNEAAEAAVVSLSTILSASSPPANWST